MSEINELLLRLDNHTKSIIFQFLSVYPESSSTIFSFLVFLAERTEMLHIQPYLNDLKEVSE